MTDVNRLDAPRRDPTANQAMSRVKNSPWKDWSTQRSPVELVLIVKRDDVVIKTTKLHDYAETKIVTHAGKVTLIETTVKEKVE